MNEPAELTRDMEQYRSGVYSILKCGYGWNGLLPEGVTGESHDAIIQKAFDNWECVKCAAEKVAVELAKAGATWAKRIDGKPNTFRVMEVVGGAA